MWQHQKNPILSVDAAVLRAIKEAEQRMAQEAALLKRDCEGEKRLAEVKIKIFEEFAEK